jgi:hypothetical protein
MTRTRSGAAGAVALVVGMLLSGCSSLPTWNGGAGAPGSGTATPSVRASTGRSSPPVTTATPTPSGSATPTATPSPTPTATPTPSGSATPSPTPTVTTPAPSPSPKPTRTAKPSPTPSPTTATLRLGSSGPQVRELQRRLVELGYWLGVRDGDFGPLTQQAVFALQKAAGIERDGVVGPNTRKALARGVRPRATLTGSGIEIDLDRQLLMVVRTGRPTLVLNTSTGNDERYWATDHWSTAFTPTGTFSVFREVDGQDDSDLGELWRPKYFLRGWAVHGSPSIPPYPASHGCARVSNAAMDMIWARGLMEIGTTVTVH